MRLTSKQRAYLKSLAMKLDPIFNIGKSSLTPEFTESINETFNNKELIKISVLKNCIDDPKEIANVLAERTGSTVVQVIGKKIVLYKPAKDEKDTITINNKKKQNIDKIVKAKLVQAIEVKELELTTSRKVV